MAAARNNLSRRAVLGAAFAVPVAMAGAADAQPVALPVENEAWTWALAALRRTEAALATFQVDHMEGADNAFNAVRRRWPISHDFARDPVARQELKAAMAAYEPFEERLNDLESEEYEAVLHLLRTPAPDIPALAAKVNLAADHSILDLDGDDECLAALKADANRLIGGADSGGL